MPFVLYRSSAGSGKTYTLVKEYLKIILEDPDTFRHILAVTFTNKAAEEMKDRIMLALKRLTKKEDPQLERMLISEINTPVKSLSGLSRDILGKLLHNYSDIALMTIDSFIHKVLRAFALEVGLPLSFAVEMNYERIQSHVVERLLAETGKIPHITDAVMTFVFHRIESERSWNIESDIRNFSMQLFNEKNYQWTDKISRFEPEMLQRFTGQLQGLVNQFLEDIRRLGQRGIGLIHASGLSVEDFPYKSSGAAGVFAKCANFTVRDIREWTPGIRFREGQWFSKGMAADIRGAVRALLDNGLEETAEQLLQVFDGRRPLTLSASAVLDNIHLASFLKRIKELVDDYKKKNNVIPIAEFNLRVNEIVRNSPTPFIYALLGEHYRHYLIDEFQDTSRLQWENLFPLIDNALASDYFNMAVGDGKQSIYRWRGGDVRIMQRDVEAMIFPEQLRVQSLNANYRSRVNIVQFNNLFFERILSGSPDASQQLEQIYRDLKQEAKGKPGGLVTLQLLDAAEGKNDDENGEAPDVDDMICGRAKIIIDRCLEAGYGLRDIAILVRDNKKARIVAEYLLKSGIPVVSPDSVSLARVPFIRFLLDMLGSLNNPTDKIMEASFIHYLCMYIVETPHPPDVIGLHLRQKAQTSLLSGLETFYLKRNHLIRLSVYEAVEELIRIFRAAEAPEFKTPGYLQAFLDIVAAYTIENSVDIASFLDWWEFNKNDFSLVVPENKEAARIMTIHKAKGLEFPIVIIPYADWEYRADRQLWLKAVPPLPTDPVVDMEMPVNKSEWLRDTYFNSALMEEESNVFVDNINLLYVAFTRAVDQLHILCRNDKKEKTGNAAHFMNYAMPMMTAETPEKGAETYSCGAPSPKDESGGAKEEIRFDTIQELVSTRWRESVSIRRKAREFWVFRRDESRGRQRSRGVLLHQLLARIVTREDLPSALASLRVSGEMNREQEKEMTSLVQKVLKHPVAGQWFERGSEVFVEAPIITDEGVYRPDRVVFRNGGAIIIDFKTGAPHPSHIEQIRTYKKTAAAAGPCENVQAFLHYLDLDEIREVV